jgi:hypothetical protein
VPTPARTPIGHRQGGSGASPTWTVRSGNLFRVLWGRCGCIMASIALAVGVNAFPASAAPAQVLAVSGIQSEQAAVVTQRHQRAINLAELAVAELTRAVSDDQSALSGANQAAAEAADTRAAALSQLGADQDALAAAIADQQAAHVQVAADRNQLRAIAVGLYTGEITNPQPASVVQLEADQQSAIDTGEVEVVAGVVVKDVRLDVQRAEASDRTRMKRAAAVDRDQQTAATASAEATAAQSRAQAAAAALKADETQSSAAAQQLASAQSALQIELAAVAGPSSPAGLSVLGAPALDATQMVTWYNAQGYVDLTTAPIQQLAAWYVEDGQREGVRGDVAFAQAILETGGFSSPDAVNLNNYAGIGHCDTCSAGWTFPSPQGGVDGQLQLLRIFAGGSAPDPIAPVLAALAPSQEPRGGCCSTWEALTGIWATDPTYGTQILSIYQQMLQFASS